MVRHQLVDGGRGPRRRAQGGPIGLRKGERAQVLEVGLLQLGQLLPALPASTVDESAGGGVEPNLAGQKRLAAAHAGRQRRRQPKHLEQAQGKARQQDAGRLGDRNRADRGDQQFVDVG